MAKRGGFPGGMPGNMNNLMKQAQRMQRQMEEKSKEMGEKEWEATAGGGAVTVKVSGKKEILSVKLDEEVVDPDDIEMLEDLIVAATNEALRKVEDENAAMMQQLTGGLGGLFSGQILYWTVLCLRTVGNGGFLWMCIVLRSRIWWNNYPTCRESAQNLHKD